MRPDSPRGSLASLGNRLARRLVLGMLGNLRGGCLLVREGDRTIRCGREPAPCAEIEVRTPLFWSRLLAGGSLAAGETWVEGLWHSPDLVAVVRLLARNLPTLDRLERRLGWLTFPMRRLEHLLRPNSRGGSRTNIAAHYDLGNEMFAAFLDSRLQYSCALFPTPEASLEQAQRHKLDVICRRLDLQPGEHLLEIGTGWGGLAVHAAQEYGCRVTTTTVSQAQFEYARARVQDEGLQDRITVLNQDYRDLRGEYDKLVSIEMIEAVGHAWLPGFFRVLGRLVRPDGRMLLQAITMAEDRYDRYLRGVDFIQRHIFPGGCLPNVSRMCQLLARETDMKLLRVHDHGPHYARTLEIWRERFLALAPELLNQGFTPDFIRLWEFYFAYCEGGFHEGPLSLVHLEARRPGGTSSPGPLFFPGPPGCGFREPAR